MFNKKVGMLILSSVAVLGLAACGGDDGGSSGGTENDFSKEFRDNYNGTLVVSGPATQGKFIAQVGALYNQKREEAGLPKVTISVVAHEESAIDSDVANWQDGPDVFAFASDKTQEIFKKGGLSPVVGKNATYVKNNNSDASITASTFSEKLYAYPYTGDNGYFLMYNKSFFAGDDADKYMTFEGISQVCAKLGKKFGYPLTTAYYGAGLLHTYGADYNVTFNEDGTTSRITADFNTQKGIDAAKLMIKIMTDPAFEDSNNVAPGINNNQIAVIDGSWNVKNYSDQLGENFGCAKMPTITLDGHEATTIGSMLGYKLMGVNGSISDSEKLAAAHNFAKYMTSPEIQEKRFDDLMVAPTATEIASKDKVKNTPSVKALAEQAPFARSQTVVPGGVWTAPETLAKGIKTGTITEANLVEAMNNLNTTIVNS